MATPPVSQQTGAKVQEYWRPSSKQWSGAPNKLRKLETNPLPSVSLSDKAEPAAETPSDNKPDSFDPPSDLEDISPERESPTEDLSDPFADFVPEEAKKEEAKEPEFENFSPDPPQFEVSFYKK